MKLKYNIDQYKTKIAKDNKIFTNNNFLRTTAS